MESMDGGEMSKRQAAVKSRRLERESDDLQTASIHNVNIVMELSLGGNVQYLSKSWEDIVGIPIRKLMRRPISRVIVGDLDDRQVFVQATKVMVKDDSSFRVHFTVKAGGPRKNSDTLDDELQALSTSLPPEKDLVGFGGRSGAKRGFHMRNMSNPDHLYEDLGDDDDDDDDEGGDTDEDDYEVNSIGSGFSLPEDDSESTIDLEGQGIVIHGRSGKPSHTMWVLKPHTAPKPLRIDLPQELVENLGFGADVLVNYLEDLSNSMITDMDAVPPPSTELCRICERHVPTWWFEQHSNFCVLEHRAESELQMAHESLMEQRSTIVSLLKALDNRSTSAAPFMGAAVAPSAITLDQPPSPPGSASSSSSDNRPPSSSINSAGGGNGPDRQASQTPVVEYRGFPLPVPAPVAPASSSPPRSPRPKRMVLTSSIASPSRRSPLKLMELLIELCDMALEIHTPELKLDVDNDGMELDDEDGEVKVHSPQSETRIHQVLGWPSSQVENEGLSLLCIDTETYSRRKVDAALRLGNTILYSERIRREVEQAVHEVIEEAVNKMVYQQHEEYYGEEEDATVDEDEGDVEMMGPMETENDNGDEEFGTIERPKNIFSQSYLNTDALPSSPANSPAIAHGVALRGHSQSPASRLNLSTSPSSAFQGTSFRRLNIADELHSSPSAAKVQSRSRSGSCSSSSSCSFGLQSSIYRQAGGTVTPKSLLAGHHSSSLPQPQQLQQQQQGQQQRQPPLPLLTAPPTASAIASSSNANTASSSRPLRPRVFTLLGATDSDSNTEDHITDISLQRVRPRRSFNQSINPIGSPRLFGSPLSKPRGFPMSESMGAQSPSTPFSSPLLIPFEQSLERHHRRQSSAASDFSRAPVSPLLSSTVPSMKPPQPSIRDYEIISPISKGAFGSVYLSRKKLTGEYFAIKVLKKADMIAKNQVMNVKAERAILMSQADSPFVAKLYFTFQSKDYLFLVMEYLNGGDCAALIKALGGLSESWAQKYIAEVVVGLEDLHKKGIVHRDLKPDNLLIDNQGHLKLTDFGLSRMGVIGRHTRVRKDSQSSNSTTTSAATTTTSSGVDTPVTEFPSRILEGEIVGRAPSQGNVLHDPNISLVPGYFSLYRTGSTPGTSTNAIISSTALSSGSSSGFERIRASSSDIQKDAQGHVTPPMVLFDPNDSVRKFVGTPDYLAPETVQGIGQDEMSDWWSLGCILFELLFGYPPFHDDTPEKVFNNILARNIQWPEPKVMEELGISTCARNLIDRLLCMDPSKRIGSEKGAHEIKKHSFFAGITDWQNLRSEKASFVPDVDNPESTDYFDLRGAVMQDFPEEMTAEHIPENAAPLQSRSVSSAASGYQSEDNTNTNTTINNSTDVLSNPSGTSGKVDRMKFLPLHIPPHVRDGRVRRLSEPAAHDDFGTFSFKNLPELERANRELIYRLRSESNEQKSEGRTRGLSISTASLKRNSSPSSNNSGQASPRAFQSAMSPILSPSIIHGSVSALSPNRSFQRHSTFSNDEDQSPASAMPIMRKASSSSSHQSFGSPETTSGATLHPHRRPSSFRRLSNMESSPELREQFRRQSQARPAPNHIFEMSPCNSDTEDSRSSAILKVQRRRQQVTQKKPTSMTGEPTFRTLNVLVCDINPVWRYSAEKLLVRLGCRVVSVSTGPEAIRRATGDVKFDIIILEYRLPKTSGTDVSRLIHNTMNLNTDTPVVLMTNFVTDAAAECEKNRKAFDGMIEKPLTTEKLIEQLKNLCNWKPQDESSEGSPKEKYRKAF